MKVGAVVVAALAASLIASPMPVLGQGLKELLVGSQTGPTGSYKKNNIIKVRTTSSRNESVGVAASRAVTELAEMTNAKGFPLRYHQAGLRHPHDVQHSALPYLQCYGADVGRE